MKTMSYYDDEYPRRGKIFSTIMVSIVSAIIGGLLALSLAPVVYGPEFFNLPGRLGGMNQDGREGQQGTLPPASLDYTPVVAIAENVGPTIVGISNQATRRSIFGNQGLVEQGSGSGVIISRDGYIVTNYHVI
jgi:serine protease Do